MNNENTSLSNEDFRSLVDKKLDNNSSSNNSSSSSGNKKKKWINRDYEYYKNAPDKKQDSNYIDRAKERRNQNDEGGSQIKKGLDFELLHNTKERLNLDKQQQQQSKVQHQQSESERIKSIKTKTQLGSSITKILSTNSDKSTIELKKKQQEKHNKEIFQLNRMIYLFDLDPVFTQLIPTTILNSKDDCPKVKETMSAHLDSNILKRVINYYHPDKEIQFKKQINSGVNDNDSDNIFSDSDNEKKDNIVVIERKDNEDDSGSDIFSDVEDYVCEVNNNNNKSTTKSTSTLDIPIKSHNYFGKEKEDYSNEFNPIGKEGDELESNSNVNKKKEEEEEEEGEVIFERRNDNQDSDDEYTYPNTDENYEQHEKDKQILNQDNDVYDIPRPPQVNNQDDDEQQEEEEYGDEYSYPNTDGNYIDRQVNEQDDDIPSGPQISNDSDDEDEYAYPNTDENYEQHEKDYMIEQERRLNDSSSSEEEDNIISLDTNNEKLKRKLMETYGDDDIYPQFDGFGRERGEKINIDEMYQFKKSTNNSNKDNQRSDEQKKKQKLNKDMGKINQIMKKQALESGKKHYDLFDKKK